MPKLDDEEKIEHLGADDPYWLRSAMLKVRKRHAAAHKNPATFADFAREVEKEMRKQQKKRLGVPSRKR
jgi:hypothetical protein